MRASHRVGDLVHIPQSVALIVCQQSEDPQLTIPMRVEETTEPRIGVVTRVSDCGYTQVYCGGSRWSVATKNIYSLKV
jgi:hypothetical protein